MEKAKKFYEEIIEKIKGFRHEYDDEDEIISMLDEAERDPEIDINYIGTHGTTILIELCENVYLKRSITKILKNERLDVNICEFSGWHALNACCAHNGSEALKLLLQHTKTNVNPDSLQYGHPIKIIYYNSSPKKLKMYMIFARNLELPEIKMWSRLTEEQHKMYNLIQEYKENSFLVRQRLSKELGYEAEFEGPAVIFNYVTLLNDEILKIKSI